MYPCTASIHLTESLVGVVDDLEHVVVDLLLQRLRRSSEITNSSSGGKANGKYASLQKVTSGTERIDTILRPRA